MKKKTHLVAVVIAALVFSVPGVAQQQQKKGKDKDSSAARDNRGPSPRAGDWLRRNMNTPPNEQKQELEKDQQFKKLPAQQQQQLLNRLQHFNSMSPTQKQRVLNHMDWLEHLSPDEQNKARNLHQQFHSLSADRRQAVRRALFSMRDMPPDDRRRQLDSDQMKKDYSDQERQIIKGYTDLGFPDEHTEESQGPQEPMMP